MDVWFLITLSSFGLSMKFLILFHLYLSNKAALHNEGLAGLVWSFNDVYDNLQTTTILYGDDMIKNIYFIKSVNHYVGI